MQKFEFLRQPLLGELAMSWREEKKMPYIVATYVYARSQGHRMHSARTKIASSDKKRDICPTRGLCLKFLSRYIHLQYLLASF